MFHWVFSEIHLGSFVIRLLKSSLEQVRGDLLLQVWRWARGTSWPSLPTEAARGARWWRPSLKQVWTYCMSLTEKIFLFCYCSILYLIFSMSTHYIKMNGVHITFSPVVGLLHPFPMDCVQIMKNGNKKSGIYTVYINNERSKPIEVYCDMDTDGGGWLVWMMV